MNRKLMFWIPRVLAVLIILFVIMFSLDSFEGTEPFWKKVLGFLINNIFAFIIIASLIAGWKKDIIAGVLFILITLAGCIFFHSFRGNPGSLIVMAPVLLTGMLFFVSFFISLKEKKREM